GMGGVPAARGNIGYQGAGTDAAMRFHAMFTAAGGHPHFVHHTSAARAEILALVSVLRPRKVLLGSGRVLEALGLGYEVVSQVVELARTDSSPLPDKDDYFAADLG